MSWKSARIEAGEWIDRLQLSRAEIEGKVIDLRPHAHHIERMGLYREMVFRAAARILKSRGAAGTILPD